MFSPIAPEVAPIPKAKSQRSHRARLANTDRKHKLLLEWERRGITGTCKLCHINLYGKGAPAAMAMPCPCQGCPHNHGARAVEDSPEALQRLAQATDEAKGGWPQRKPRVIVHRTKP